MPVAEPSTLGGDGPLAAAPAAAVGVGPDETERPLGTRVLALAACLAVLLLACAVSLAVGARAIPLDVVWRTVTGSGDGSFDATVILDDRVPRTVAALAAGLGLGVAGALMQAVTRNPLADPGILGVTSGSAFAIALGIALGGVVSPSTYLWLAFLGALTATVVVYLIGAVHRGSVSIARLTLAGVALAALLNGVTSGLVLTNPRSFDALRAWQAGSLKDRGWEVVAPAAPWIVAGAVVALLLGRALNAVALGDDLAASLGARVLRTRTIAVVAVTLLAGGATAIAGPVTFIGLMVPHVARRISGPDQRWIMAFTVLLGPVLLVTADIVGRLLLPVGEIPAGIVTAFIGAPVLVFLVRRYRMAAL
ncbi:iron chelate uptake ABC transporter family permease subunit [Nocardioides hwasunensis]|uniref:Iron chelate uptake ABC transporter family permease subunit n=1 Tax=Nocardioides hwasunensis TaxID=397258 RepID=A0ABR8MNK7_9ACTN|nr:iron chelate uptake ABC transporter family permease subunit [Nocardioides hwasunensis]MBD3915694.1 iron chelate uptake ABC transporter family permease subunit [Nocardioides hwasunensis]